MKDDRETLKAKQELQEALDDLKTSWSAVGDDLKFVILTLLGATLYFLLLIIF